MKQSLHREAELLERYWNNQLTEGERIELEQWASQSEDRRMLLQKFSDERLLQQELAVMEEGDKERIWKILQGADASLPSLRPAKVRRIWPPMAAAAAAIFMIVLIGYFLFNERNEKPDIATTPIVQQDIAPGLNKATLRLSDGRLIVLDSAATGALAQQGSVKVLNENGKLVYDAAASDKAELAYNTLMTARGQTYPLVLSDHSRVWLNAESSIRYPVQFANGERRVEITGEAYFEIAHDASRPFIATVNGLEVRVLGTQFNVNAYPDEGAMKTTLVSGSVRVTNGIRQMVIKPGQQAEVGQDSIKVHSADVNSAVAWKKGYFSFKNMDVPAIMRQVARWYDVQVVYEGRVPQVQLSGESYRNTTLSGLLKILKFSGVNCRMEGRKLMISE